MEIKYLPINTTSLHHYFRFANIIPNNYLTNKKADIQDEFPDFLLLSEYRGVQESDCCLEVILTKEEISELIDIKGGWFLYEKPLPISRIRKIYFTNNEKKDTTITNINMSTAFIPENLVEVIEKFENATLTNIERPIDIHLNNLENDIKKFDKFLGALALMRLAGETYMNYSENYFATLSYFNENIFKDIKSFKEKNSRFTIDTRYQDIFKDRGGFEKIMPYLYKNIDERDLEKIAHEENQKIKKNPISREVNLESLDKWTYTVAVLNTYGVGNESKKRKIDDLILANFRLGIKSDKYEGIALCYGFNRGYSAFINSYNTEKNRKIVKYQLDSQLDYYTIESIYQYIFNKQKSNSFPYLDKWIPKKDLVKISRKANYKILDVIVIGKKAPKVMSKEYWIEIISILKETKLLEFSIEDLFKRIGEIIYSDTRDEIKEKYEEQIHSFQNEIESLKKNLLQEKEKNEELQNTKRMKNDNDFVQRDKTYNSLNALDENDLRNFLVSTVNKYAKYNKVNLPILLKKAINDGLFPEKGIKKHDLIIKLMSKDLKM